MWYFYGLVLNSIRLGIDSTFGETRVDTIWSVNPGWNPLADALIEEPSLEEIFLHYDQ